MLAGRSNEILLTYKHLKIAVKYTKPTEKKLDDPYSFYCLCVSQLKYNASAFRAIARRLFMFFVTFASKPRENIVIGNTIRSFTSHYQESTTPLTSFHIRIPEAKQLKNSPFAKVRITRTAD